ncbi:unnamed protein product, partial [Mesorhabditis belari]|uniref:BPTI/Kunitz inhibitor domain-containing protein n=1 Tax=Mesorhabditis belari TaxID=2138241 RepID=A0AAF3EW21_9BILA
MKSLLFFIAFFYFSSAELDCSSSRDAGYSCSSGSPKKFFYFDKRAKVCQPLFYKGCGGNENRYETAAECKEKCLNEGKTTGNGGEKHEENETEMKLVLKAGHEQWTHATKCNATFLIPNHKYIECTNGGCPENHSCYNGNCCPNRDYVCSLPDENGDFQEGVDDKPRFGWSDQWHTCVRFSYYGANGNYNNFPNFNLCQKYCNPKNRH